MSLSGEELKWAQGQAQNLDEFLRRLNRQPTPNAKEE